MVVILLLAVVSSPAGCDYGDLRQKGMCERTGMRQGSFRFFSAKRANIIVLVPYPGCAVWVRMMGYRRCFLLDLEL